MMSGKGKTKKLKQDKNMLPVGKKGRKSMAESKKYIIVNWGKAGVGKTPSLRTVYELLSAKYPHKVLRSGNDIKAIVTIGDCKVGIETQGDPKPYLVTPQSMEDFRNEGCRIVVAACRTSGETWDAVYEMETKYGYQLFEALHHRPYDTILSDASSELLNQHYAEGIVALIEDMAYGRI